MWDALIGYLKGNMKTIKKILGPIIVICLLAFLLTWYINDMRYGDSLASYESSLASKDATIEAKDAYIQQLKNVREIPDVLVFDKNGKILSNTAMDLIKEFTVEEKKAGKSTLVVTLKSDQYLENIPVIQPLVDGIINNWDVTRSGNTVRWEGVYSTSDPKETLAFRLELYNDKQKDLVRSESPAPAKK